MSKRKSILLHIAIWLSYGVILGLIFNEFHTRTYQMLRLIPVLGFQILLFYTNSEVLLPKLLNRKKYALYILVVTGLFLAVYSMLFGANYLIKAIFESEHSHGQHPHMHERPTLIAFFFHRLLFNVFSLVTVLFISTVYRNIKDASAKSKAVADVQQNQLKNELKALKSQINPHFLLNALNNIYSLSVDNSEQTSEAIHTLSTMLRYLLYECNEDEVSLGQEITYIQHYIKFCELKDENFGRAEFRFENANPKLRVAPMLFMPFIENSFKHSKMELDPNGWIKILLKTEEDKLIFHCRNSIYKPMAQAEVNHGGIGLRNIQTRLQLLFGDRHKLSICRQTDRFDMTLTIHGLSD